MTRTILHPHARPNWFHSRVPFEVRLARWESDPQTNCWNWTGYVNPGGYGKMGETLAHRATYEYFVAPIPAGLTLDHLCRNRRCVNPAHLEPATTGENSLRGWLARGYAPYERCLHGHTDLTYRKTGKRAGQVAYCNTCRNEYRRRKYAEAKRILEAQDAA